MIPTSLSVAGFAPAEDTLSSSLSATGSAAYNAAGDTSDQGSSFRQVMNAYRRSNEDNDSDGNQEAAQRSEREQAAWAKDETRSNDQAAAADAAAGNQQASTSSFTGAFGLRQGSEDEDGADNTAQSGAETPAAANTTAGGAALPLAGLSTLEMLLKGGSLPQVLAGANAAAVNTGETAALPGGTGAEANAKAGGDAVKLVVATALGAKSLATATAINSKGKAKAEDQKRTQDASGTGTPELSLAAANALVAGASGTQSNEGDAAKSAQSGLAISGRTPEALHLSAAGTNENSSLAAAQNFAFAVRLTGGGAHAQIESNAATPGPLALAAAAQANVVTAEAQAAASGGAGAETGGHGGGTPEQAAMLLGGEAVPVPATAHNTAAAAASEEATPAATTDAAPAPQTEPVRNVRLQLAGENNQRVDIRLVEVGGEMRVSVRAGDTKLAQTLQDHLPDLSTRLNQQSVRSEIWSPRTENTAQPNSSNQSGQPGRGDTPGQGGQQGQRQGNGRQQQNQPDWVDELENYSSRTTTTRSNQAWPQ